MPAPCASAARVSVLSFRSCRLVCLLYDRMRAGPVLVGSPGAAMIRLLRHVEGRHACHRRETGTLPEHPVAASTSALHAPIPAPRRCTARAWVACSLLTLDLLAPVPSGITTTYDDHLIIVGDAAGFIDPLTGAWAPP